MNDALAKLPLWRIKGLQVELLRDLVTRGGKEFHKGSVMRIAARRRSFALADGGKYIRGVERQDFRLIDPIPPFPTEKSFEGRDDSPFLNPCANDALSNPKYDHPGRVVDYNHNGRVSYRALNERGDEKLFSDETITIDEWRKFAEGARIIRLGYREVKWSQ